MNQESKQQVSSKNQKLQGNVKALQHPLEVGSEKYSVKKIFFKKNFIKLNRRFLWCSLLSLKFKVIGILQRVPQNVLLWNTYEGLHLTKLIFLNKLLIPSSNILKNFFLLKFFVLISFDTAHHFQVSPFVSYNINEFFMNKEVKVIVKAI